MPVLGVLSVTLEVPDLEVGRSFYSDAGLQPDETGDRLGFHCPGQAHNSIVLIGGAQAKRLHHICFRASEIDEIAKSVEGLGGEVVSAPRGFGNDGIWIRDPHRVLFHLLDHSAETISTQSVSSRANGPRGIARRNHRGVPPSATEPGVKPLRLGHVLLFTPDVGRSVEFATKGLRLALADHAQDVIAFCCARKNSDHHVLAFAKSEASGFHHVSFQVSDPHEVGRAGSRLARKSRGNWGFGRHTIGSNYFHYVQDPWGSWFEYYADMDYIEDYRLWSPRNYGLEDSLASWGPEVPRDFVHNYEAASASSS